MMDYPAPTVPLGNPFEDEEIQESLTPPTPPTDARRGRPSGMAPMRQMARSSTAARSSSSPASRTAVRRASHNQPTPARRDAAPSRAVEKRAATTEALPQLRPLNAPKTVTLRRDIGGVVDLPAPEAERTIRPVVALEPLANESAPTPAAVERSPLKKTSVENNPVETRDEPMSLRTAIPVNPLRSR